MIELQEARRSDDVVMAFPPIRYDVDVVPEVVEGQTLYVASHPELRHVRAQGASVQQAIENLIEVADAYLADMVAAGIAVLPAKDQPRMRMWALDPSSTSQPDPFKIEWRMRLPGD
jgi:predicted RNase H-like HicB family nuclease